MLAAVLDGPIRVTPLGAGLDGHFHLEVPVKTPESVYCTTYGVPNGDAYMAHIEREALAAEASA